MFTVITVAVNQIHLAVPLAITVALIIASIKGSHGGHRVHAPEPRTQADLRVLLLTVAFFIVLMPVPMSTNLDKIVQKY